MLKKVTVHIRIMIIPKTQTVDHEGIGGCGVSFLSAVVEVIQELLDLSVATEG